jgi:hypothetical protein
MTGQKNLFSFYHELSMRAFSRKRKTGIHHFQWIPALTTSSDVLVTHVDCKGNDQCEEQCHEVFLAVTAKNRQA